jgi:hypothetical protein
MLRNADAQGMREFLPTLWIWSRVTGNRSNGKSMIAERFALTDLKATSAEGEAQKVWVV